MTPEQIKAMAREADIQPPETYTGDPMATVPWIASTSDLERFAALVAAAERERCAKVCQKLDDKRHDDAEICNGYDCASAIRALG